MKKKIIELLNSDSLKEYIEGIECFRENVIAQNLSDSELDEEIIGRTCAIFLLERWASHSDYEQQLEKFMEALPKYSEYLSHDEIGHHLRGIAIFIDGLHQREIDLSGFIYQSGTGYLLANTAAQSIKEFFETEKNPVAVALFDEIALFFEEINSAQFSMGDVLTAIKEWTPEMCSGFYNILTGCTMAGQNWMMRSLYKVVDSPIVQEHIFDKYLDIVKTVRTKYEKERNAENISQVDSLIEMIISCSKGE